VKGVLVGRYVYIERGVLVRASMNIVVAVIYLSVVFPFVGQNCDCSATFYPVREPLLGIMSTGRLMQCSTAKNSI